MTQQTKIEWCDFTVNFWEGCQKVGPGCDNCYAEARDARFTGGQHWGPGAPRRKVKGGPAKLRKIQRQALAFAEEHGHLPRAFLSSLCDLFDNTVTPAWRLEAFTEIEAAFRVKIIMLTKRVGNVFQMVPPAWANGGWPSHVGLMITVVNQDEADRDIPKLLDLKAKLSIPWVGLSVEPMLGPVDLSHLSYQDGDTRHYWSALTDSAFLYGVTEDRTRELLIKVDGVKGTVVDWVICGGESGPNARPMHPEWAGSLRDQCQASGTAFFFKQWGEWAPAACIDGIIAGWRDDATLWDGKSWDIDRTKMDDPEHKWDCPADVYRIGKKAAGRLLDGREHNGFPAALMGGEG